ncbi:MAG: hypothetical protein JSW55_16995 [Chloroflexota bacterium]|nr:MAG: hypothetical protein JSW55_16995 [Chloroflexota bacterium]
MMKRFAFVYLMQDEPERVADIAPKHVAYWQSLSLPLYAGGPFADRSGGLITFAAENHEVAADFAREDPFMRESLLDQCWLKEWAIE